MRRLLLGLAITVGATALAVLPAGAGVSPTVSGAVTCGADTGGTITWTFTTTAFPVVITNAGVVVSGAVNGTATFTPSLLNNTLPESATATTPFAAGVGGQVIITVPWEGDGPSGTETAAVTIACTPTPAESVDATPRTVG